MPRRVVLVGDLQHGSRLDALGEFAWPADVELDLKTVADHASNAGLQRLADAAEAAPGRAAEGSSASGSPTTRARLARPSSSSWIDANGKGGGRAPVDVYVPPGESRVVRVPRPADRDHRRPSA